MTTTAKVLCDSLNPKGVRLTTLELYFPRFILAQVNTHRLFSRNAQSSRALPIARLIQMVKDDPVVPSFGENQKGMVAGEKLSEQRAGDAKWTWLRAMDTAIKAAEDLTLLNVHKEAVNRLLEPFAHIRVILSATQWRNFFRQRLAHDAQPEMQALARAIKEAMDASTSRQLNAGEWHLPLIDERDAGLPIDDLVGLSTARCARVSYLTHDGKRDPSADFTLYDFLKENLHLSPFEHPAKAMNDTEMHANFKGFRQHRADIAGESGEVDPPVAQWIIDAVREGQELSNALREKTRGMRNITEYDLKRR